ncbi:MAG TPA: RsmE family RNA methyltransferase, partial [Rubrivivax sp.]|nr:RsmE family RNA methyltransferase [Rubrivivax sp.]
WGLPAASGTPLVTLSGPEGGLTDDEEASAQSAGFRGTRLGPRVLRAETAPLAVLAWLSLQPSGMDGR